MKKIRFNRELNFVPFLAISVLVILVLSIGLFISSISEIKTPTGFAISSDFGEISTQATCPSGGTCFYVTPTGAGSKNGSDWNNAYAGLPTNGNYGPDPSILSSNLQRNATYYLAAGNYPGIALDDAVSGAQWIKIVKATQANSGSVAGWQASFGGRAVFLDMIRPATSYYEIDGQYRNESAWDDDLGYGFRIPFILGDSNTLPGGDNYIIKYSNIGGTKGGGLKSGLNRGVWILGRAYYNLSYNYVHDTLTPFELSNGANHIVLESNYVGPTYEKEAVIGIYNVYNIIIKNNIFVDNCQPNSFLVGAAGCTAEIGAGDSQGSGNYDNWEVYGNIFSFRNISTIPHSNSVILAGGFGSSDLANNWKVYNNIIAGLGGGSSKQITIRFSGINNFAYNNLWYDIQAGSTIGCFGGTCSNNWCYSGSSAVCNVGTNSIMGTGNPFVNYAAFDFRLNGSTGTNSPVNNGMSLTGVNGYNNLDGKGNIRGLDGNWDIGAYEFISGVQNNIYHPADLNTDLAVSLNEFTNYSSFFKLGKNWPFAPSPPDANYYSRAYFLLKRGVAVQGAYSYNSSSSCPSCFIVR